MFFGMFASDKTLCYIFVITVCAFDFWVVKNVSGRKLVGLRWWSVVLESGEEVWHFETIDQKNVSKVDSRIFWASQYAMGSLWLIFALASLLTFGLTNCVVCCIALTLSCINTWGYIKCDKEHQKKVGGFFYKRANSSLSTKQKAKLGMMAMSGSSGLGAPSPSSGM